MRTYDYREPSSNSRQETQQQRIISARAMGYYPDDELPSQADESGDWGGPPGWVSRDEHPVPWEPSIPLIEQAKPVEKPPNWKSLEAERIRTNQDVAIVNLKRINDELSDCNFELEKQNAKLQDKIEMIRSEFSRAMRKSEGRRLALERFYITHRTDFEKAKSDLEQLYVNHDKQSR